MGGDYGWGDLAITNDGHILFARNDGDSTGTIWRLDIVTDSFAPLDYGVSNEDLYVACTPHVTAKAMCPLMIGRLVIGLETLTARIFLTLRVADPTHGALPLVQPALCTYPTTLTTSFTPSIVVASRQERRRLSLTNCEQTSRRCKQSIRPNCHMLTEHPDRCQKKFQYI